MSAVQLKRLSVRFLAMLPLAIFSVVGAQESTPPELKEYPDEPAWVHELPPKLTDRIWHARPAPATAKVQPLKGVRVVDYGGEIVRRHDDNKTGQPTFMAHLGMGLIRGVDVGDGSGKTNGRIQYRPFSMDIPFSGRPPAYDIESNNAVFYGGAVVFLAGEKGGLFEEFGINTAEGKNWTFIVQDSAIRSLMDGMLLWKKENFRYGGDGHRVSFDETSKIGLHVKRYMWRMDELRYVVQDGEQFYISEYNCGTVAAQQFFQGKGDTSNPAASGLGPHTLGEGGGVVFGMKPTETRWARYAPKAPYHIAFDQKKAKYEKHTFTDVRSVGFYVAKNTWEPKAMAIKWYAFEMLGTVHRPLRPSETLDTAEVKGRRDPKGKAIPAFHISKCEIPYVLFQRVRRWAVSPQYAFDEFYPYLTNNDGDMGSMDYGPDGKLLEHGSEEPVAAAQSMCAEYEQGRDVHPEGVREVGRRRISTADLRRMAGCGRRIKPAACIGVDRLQRGRDHARCRQEQAQRSGHLRHVRQRVGIRLGRR